MIVYKVSAKDKFLCLEKMSVLWKKSKNPAVIIYDDNSPPELIENFLSCYDVSTEGMESIKTVISEDDTLITYGKENFPLALFAFPLFVKNRGIFIEKKRLEKLENISCKNLIVLGDTEIPKIMVKEKVYQLKTGEGVLKFCSKTFSTLVIINSEDLNAEEIKTFSRDYVCPSLSILGSYIAAIREGIIYDASSKHPEGRETEQIINSSPEFEEIDSVITVGTAGTLPFIKSHLPDFIVGYNWRSDIIRECTLWKGNYIRASHGRITGLNILDASLLFMRSFLIDNIKALSLKGISASDSITCLERMGAAAEVPTLRTSASITAENLEKYGWKIEKLYGEENTFSRIKENLENARLLYIGNHGIMLYIRCGGKSFGSEDLPSSMPSTQIFCLSCLTARTTGLWLSRDEINWDYAPVPPEKSLPLMAIRRGASSFMGLLMAGYELESDVMVSEILKNMTLLKLNLGEAVKEARNTITALYKSYLPTVGREARGNYQQWKFYGEITVNEPVIYGDPLAVLPAKEEKTPESCIKYRDKENIKEVFINIPPESWKTVKMPVTGKSQDAYYTKSFKTFHPQTPDSVLAGWLPVERNPQTFIAKESIGYYFIKIKAEIPRGHTVKYIELKDVKILEAFDFYGKKLDLSCMDAFSIFGKFRYGTNNYRKPEESPVHHNWPFTIEKGKDKETVWFFMPATTVTENPGIIANLLSAGFSVHHCKAYTLKGKIISTDKTPLDAILTFMGPGGKIRVTDTDEEGNYEITLPEGKYWLSIESDLHINFSEEIIIDKDRREDFHMKLKDSHPVTIKVCDGKTEEPLSGAVVRSSVLFGPRDRKMIELYTKGKERYPHRFIKEYITGEDGRIKDNLTEGDYILDIYKKKDSPGAIYLRQECHLEVFSEVKEKVFKMTPAGTVSGRLLYEDTGKGIPDSTVIIKVKTEPDGVEKHMRFHTDMEGIFHATVPAGYELKILGAFEGYKTEEIDALLNIGEVKEVTLFAKRIF